MTTRRLSARSAGSLLSRSCTLALLVWLALTGLFYLTLADFYQGAVLMGNRPSFESKRQVVFWAGMLPALALWVYAFYAALTARPPARLLGWLGNLRARIPLILRGLVALVLLLVPTYLFLYGPAGAYSLGYWSRLGTLLVFSALAALALFTFQSGVAWMVALAGMALLAGSFFTAAGWLNQVTNYPFSLSWSEGNRIYDYSMLFGSSRYPGLADKPAYTFITLGRQLLWAFPFLLPGVDLWGMRLWDAFLWIAPALLLGWLALSVPRSPRAWLWKAAFSLWAFVFLAQGPIYAPLIVSAVGVVLAFRLRSLVLACLLVAASAYYAYISRFTWAYAPGLWAGMLALLSLDNPTLRPALWKRFLPSVVLGLCGYAGGQLLPQLIRWSGSGGKANIEFVANAGVAVSRQPLLWDRLWPNPTYPPGILLGTLWAALPVIVLLAWLLARRIWRPNWLQLLAAGAVTLAFLVVGLIASVKIGGGSNLHNLDMFWLTLVLLVGHALPSLLKRADAQPAAASWATLAVVCLALLFPVTYTVSYGEPLSLPPAEESQEALAAIQDQVAQAGQRGDVLFIDQRQLVTFGLVPPVPFIDQYEKKLLMDKAMGDAAKYFDTFHDDLQRRRFALIITEPLRVNYITGDDRNFSEENNAWVRWVSDPILTYYQPLHTFEQVGVQILVPKK